MSKTLAWGILGTGLIANVFAADLAKSRTGTLIAWACDCIEPFHNFEYLVEHYFTCRTVIYRFSWDWHGMLSFQRV